LDQDLSQFSLERSPFLSRSLWPRDELDEQRRELDEPAFKHRDRELAQRTNLLLFGFSSPFIDTHHYRLRKATNTIAHVPTFLLRHPTATERGRQCRAELHHSRTLAWKEKTRTALNWPRSPLI
jgi:hypothetical protein